MAAYEMEPTLTQVAYDDVLIEAIRSENLVIFLGLRLREVSETLGMAAFLYWVNTASSDFEFKGITWPSKALDDQVTQYMIQAGMAEVLEGGQGGGTAIRYLVMPQFSQYDAEIKARVNALAATFDTLEQERDTLERARALAQAKLDSIQSSSSSSNRSAATELALRQTQEQIDQIDDQIAVIDDAFAGDVDAFNYASSGGEFTTTTTDLTTTAGLTGADFLPANPSLFQRLYYQLEGQENIPFFQREIVFLSRWKMPWSSFIWIVAALLFVAFYWREIARALGFKVRKRRRKKKKFLGIF